MRYLVLGSQGQIGKHLCNLISSTGNHAEGFDVLCGSGQDLRVKDNPYLHHAIEQCDKIFFLAYDVGGAKYLINRQQSKEFLDDNLSMMINTFDCISKHNKPFLFASSQMAYNTASSYGALKLIGEHYTKNLKGVIVKLWNVYGKEDLGLRSHVITDFVHAAVRDKHIKMMTKGDEQRQFLHADDCAVGLKTLLDLHDGSSSAEYHVTSFEWTSIASLAIMISSLVDGCKVTIGTGEDVLQGGYQLEPDDAVRSLWNPKISLQQGIKEMLADAIPADKVR